MLNLKQLLRLCGILLMLEPEAQSHIARYHNKDLESEVHTRESFDPVTQDSFFETVRRIRSKFSPIIFDQGGDLNVIASWASNTVNATASQRGDNWNVTLYGGLARRPEMTQDGFMLVACHEIGHHLAGYPQFNSWGAAEGNADYFAIYGCARGFWEDETQINALFATVIPPFPKSICDDRFRMDSQERKDLCYREVMAAFSLAELLSYIVDEEINVDTPSEYEAPYTNLDYPTVQCRFDTLVQSALCEETISFDVIPWTEREMAAVSCHQSKGQTEGLRPRCGFK